MQKYEFLLIRIFPYKVESIVDSVLIRENTGQRKPVYSHILHSDWQLCTCRKFDMIKIDHQ